MNTDATPTQYPRGAKIGLCCVLSADSRETLEDALRMFVETAADEENARERLALAQALEAELGESRR